MTEQNAVLDVDIVSDVVCPWCIIGYRQLEIALSNLGVGAYVRWHPFELNPSMPPQGQELREHIAEKYGSSAEDSAKARARITALGEELGFTFAFSDASRIYNTFDAHRLLGWAATQNLQHPLKMALFETYFTHGRNVSDFAVLADAAEAAGLDKARALEFLQRGDLAQATRGHLNEWVSRGITGVPAIILGRRYLLTGAQGVEGYGRAIQQCLSEMVADNPV